MSYPSLKLNCFSCRFQLIIFCDAHQFKVAVNGVHTLEYKHRFKQLEKINVVEVIGDVKLLDVRSW